VGPYCQLIPPPGGIYSHRHACPTCSLCAPGLDAVSLSVGPGYQNCLPRRVNPWAQQNPQPPPWWLCPAANCAVDAGVGRIPLVGLLLCVRSVGRKQKSAESARGKNRSRPCFSYARTRLVPLASLLYKSLVACDRSHTQLLCGRHGRPASPSTPRHVPPSSPVELPPLT
jgi:hypothetical protein